MFNVMEMMTMHEIPVLNALDQFRELKRNVDFLNTAAQEGSLPVQTISEMMVPLEAMVGHIRDELTACEAGLSKDIAPKIANLIKDLGHVDEAFRAFRALAAEEEA